ncbi:MAG: substrate-binding periplasmic protein [Rhodoferax sp.]
MHVRTWFMGLLLTLFPLLATAQRVIVATEEDPPYNYLDPGSQQIVGLSTEVVKEALKRAKVDYQLGLYAWARAYHMAQEQPNVLIFSIARTAPREKLFQWVDIIVPYNVYMYRLKSRPEVQAQSLEQLKGYRIGAVRDDVRAQYLEKNGVPLDLVVENGSNVKKLASGRIDMFPIDEIAQVSLYKREGLDPASVEKVMPLPELSVGLYMAFSLQTDPALVERCRAAMREMRRDGTLDKIKARYL